MDEPTRQPPHRPARWLLGAAAALVLAAAGLTGYLVSRPGPAQHRVAAPVAQLRVAPPSPPVSSSAPPAAPPVPHDVVAPAPPTAFVLSGAGFTIRARVCSMPPVFPLDPPGEQHHTVCWVTKGFGVAPGSDSGTSYILGHSWAEDSREVLNAASARATAQILQAKARPLDGVPVYPVSALTGARLTLQTRAGTLSYVVRDAYGVDKLKLGQISSALDASIHDRVVLITCAELHGRDYDYNVVADAYLVSSKASATRG